MELFFIDFIICKSKKKNIIARSFYFYTEGPWICCRSISSVESEKGTITIQRCSVENQKGATAIDFV